MADDLAPVDTAPIDRDLYDRDYLAWTDRQAQLLRAGPAGVPYLDFLNLIEEVESLGRSERAAAESQVENILEHLIKIQFIGPARTAPHWGKEITAFRRTLQRRLTPTLAARLPERLQGSYEAAEARAAVYALHAGVAFDPPKVCPYGWDQVTDESWLPPARD